MNTPKMSDREAEPWPPVPPDVDFLQLASTSRALENQPFGNSRNQLYRLQDPSHHHIFKFNATQREYELQTAAAKCSIAIATRGRALHRDRINGCISCQGFFMDLEITFPKDGSLTSEQRKTAAQQMIKAVEVLHEKG